MSKSLLVEIKGKKGKLLLNRTLFWDVSIIKLDAEKNSRLIIERVFTRGRIDEFSQVLHYYDKLTIKELIIKSGSLDKKSLNFVSKLFNIPKKDFLCYKKKLLVLKQ